MLENRIVSPDWHWDTQDFIKDFDIWVPLSGRGSLKSDNTTYQIIPGDCFLLRPNQRYIFKQNPDYPFVVIYIHFDIIDFNGEVIKLEQSEMPLLNRYIGSFKFFSSLLERVVTAYRKKSDTGYDAEHWLKSVLIEMSTYDSASEYTGLEQLQLSIINEVYGKIERDPLLYSNIKKIAEIYSYSPDHLCRLFKKYIGITPSDFVILSRVEHAKVLLKSSSYSIGKISELLGYSDINHFSNQFNKRTGLSPSKYRRVLAQPYFVLHIIFPIQD